MMTPDPSALSLGAAIVTGLAATGHSTAMCGGIAGALATRHAGTELAGLTQPQLAQPMTALVQDDPLRGQAALQRRS